MAKDCILSDKTVHYKTLTLHPGCFDNSFPYIIAVSKHDKVTLRKFQIVEGFSCPIVLDEEKPGMKGFDCVWQKDGTIVTYQVMRVRDSSPVKSQQVRNSQDKKNKNFNHSVDVRPKRANLDIDVLGSDVDDLDYDDGSSVAMNSNVRYCI